MASYERYREYATASAADLATNNAVLEAGQVVVESDTGRIKVGDGSTAYTSLSSPTDFTAVWNNAGTTFTGIKFNVTDTASAAGSLLMDLQVGGTSRFRIAKNGNPRIKGNTVDWVLDANAISSTLVISANGVANVAAFNTDGAKSLQYAFSSTINAATDLILARDAADTLAQRRSTNAQTFRVYNNYMDASNYERGKIQWDSNVLKIGTEKAGSFITARALELQTDGTTRVTIAGTGAVTFATVVTFNTSILPYQVLVDAVRYLGWQNRSLLSSPADGIVAFTNGATTDFNRLQLGGTTSSFPSLKRSTTSLQARLADDSAFTNIQGKLTTDTAYTAGAPTPAGYLVLYDSTGTAYKIPAEAV